MILRNFKKEDAPIIAEWLRSEEELYKWSADRFNKYPVLSRFSCFDKNIHLKGSLISVAQSYFCRT